MNNIRLTLEDRDQLICDEAQRRLMNFLFPVNNETRYSDHPLDEAFFRVEACKVKNARRELGMTEWGE